MVIFVVVIIKQPEGFKREFVIFSYGTPKLDSPVVHGTVLPSPCHFELTRIKAKSWISCHAVNAPSREQSALVSTNLT